VYYSLVFATPRAYACSYITFEYIHIHDYSQINSVTRENILFVITLDPQSIQSARFSFKSSELGPLSHARVCCSFPSFCLMGETHSLSGERGGGTQFRQRDRHSGTLCKL
jgi:hypothetical protein